jgi:hypothetical protein
MDKLNDFFLSVLLHAVAALIVIIFSLIAPRPLMIAPNRIRILEIDLKNVKITGLETILKNAEKGKDAERDKTKTAKAEAAQKPTPVMQTIKVNRETADLNRTMTVSIIDAFRIAMTRCWQIDSDRADLEGIRAVAHLKMYPNGKVQSFWFEQAPRADTDSAFAYVLETIRFAIEACQPFTMLPRTEYEHWKSVQLTFFPTAKTVE